MIEVDQRSLRTATPDGVIDHDEVDPSFTDIDRWDGVDLSYVPRARLRMSPSLQLHDAFDPSPDPIACEVLRWRLWNINLEHSDTLKRASGTPIVCFSDDLNTSLLTENGDTFIGGPSIQYFIGAADLAVKWTLENRSANPGIHDGDIFLVNDPYIASTHQMDTALLAPLFVDRKLFSWTFSCAHQRDLGGGDLGGFGVNTADIYGEPLPWPAIALVRGGELQRDVMDLFRRQSRFPDLCELQTRAQIAGANAVRTRLTEVLDEHGPAVVKGAMRRMIRDTSMSVSERLLQVPDGAWSQTTYVNGNGGRALHRVQVNLRKDGDRLIFSNAGTDPQVPGGANGPYSSFRSTALAAANALLAWDHLLCPAGVLNHLRFEPTPGTITIARHPAGVTVPFTPLLCVSQAGQVLSKMLLRGPDLLRDRAVATGASSSYQGSHTWGLDGEGQPFFGLTGDTMAGGFGASAARDGVDNGGTFWWPRGNSGNAEEWESSIPMLYLYRRSQRDSGGPGQFRGGNGLEYAVIAHRAQTFGTQLSGTHPSVNTVPGLGGGYPGHCGRWLGATSTTIRTVLASGRVPSTREELESAVGPLRDLRNGERFDLGATGVLVVHRTAGGGFGDPLRRPADVVANDVADDTISAPSALRDYGVVLAPDGSPDIERTNDERRARVRGRFRRSGRSEAALPPSAASEAAVRADALSLVLLDRQPTWICIRCGGSVASVEQGPRSGAMMWQSAPCAVDPDRYPDSRAHIDHELVLREWCCPHCASLLAVDICLADDAPMSDEYPLLLDIAANGTSR